MSSTPSAGSKLLGTLRSESGAGVVRIQDRYDTDIEDLWTAITDPARLARWYGQVDGDLRVGGRFRTYVEAAEIESTGTVEECEPPRRLRVTTRETDESHGGGPGVPPFDAGIDVSLSAVGDQTDLTIEVRGMPLDKIAFYGVGWQLHAERLAAYVAGQASGESGDRMGELIPPYQQLAAGLD